MGCGCRSGLRAVSSRKVSSPVLSVSPTRSLCSTIQSEGNNITVRIGSDGRLFLGPGYGSELPVASLLPASGCRGTFSQALLSANIKLGAIYMAPSVKSRFIAALPSISNVKLGFLREILRGF